MQGTVNKDQCTQQAAWVPVLKHERLRLLLTFCGLEIPGLTNLPGLALTKVHHGLKFRVAKLILTVYFLNSS